MNEESVIGFGAYIQKYTKAKYSKQEIVPPPPPFTSTGLTLEYYSTPCMETNRTFTVLHPMFEHATTGVQTKGDNNNNKGQVFKQRVLMW